MIAVYFLPARRELRMSKGAGTRCGMRISLLARHGHS